MSRARRLALLLALASGGCAALAGLDETFVVGGGGGAATGTMAGAPSGAGATGGSSTSTTSTATTGAGADAAGGAGAAGAADAAGAPPLGGFGGAGGTGPTVFASCQQVLDLGQSSGSHAYPIQTPTGPQALYCDQDVDGGGWTLVGQVAGKFDSYDHWLRTDRATANLATADIEDDAQSCIDAVPMAVQLATEIRLSNSAIDRWVKWTLAPGRTLATWWNHAAGYATIEAATDSPVTVHAFDGATSSCFQNVYGIMPWELHGGSYPAAARNEAGNTSPDDWCMAVGVMLAGTTADGFAQNGNGWDAPTNESSWPNTDYLSPPRVSVWLR